jgi:xanthine/uracil permease
LGGMTIFLFANVLVSGISVAANNLNMSSRRNKFILAVSLGFGVGVSIWPFGDLFVNRVLQRHRLGRFVEHDLTR